MRIWLILFSGFIFWQCTHKEITKRNLLTEDIVEWSETRKLAWSDFQGVPILNGDAIISEIVVKNPASIERSNVFAKTRLTAQCYFDKRNSWVDKNRATNELLLYNQTIFDIYELYVRKLRQTYTATDFGLREALKVFNNVVEQNNQALLQRLKEFRIASRMGAEAETVKLWSEKIIAEIQSLDEYR